MSAYASRGRVIAGFLAVLVIGSGGAAAVSCNNGTASPPTGAEPGTSQAASALRAAAGSQSPGSLPPDDSRSVVQHGPRVQISGVERSMPFRDLPQSPLPEGEEDHEPLRPPRPAWTGTLLPVPPAPMVQSRVPIVSMPVTIRNFAGQGKANGGPCVGGVSCSTPPDPNGAVGPNHFVQTTNVNGNSGLAMWDKSGTLVAGPKHINTLWTGYVGSPGNGCAARNDGDPVVVYDQLADRWFITQFSLPNTKTDAGPSFQCVAVSQTADPTGAYYLYDFSYAAALNDYGKFGIWPDAYYATINNFGANGFLGADFCAYDRNSMVKGVAATQQCFLQPYPSTFPACPAIEPFAIFGALPISMDGKIPPPRGEPGLIAHVGRLLELVGEDREPPIWSAGCNEPPVTLRAGAHGAA